MPVTALIADRRPRDPSDRDSRPLGLYHFNQNKSTALSRLKMLSCVSLCHFDSVQTNVNKNSIHERLHESVLCRHLQADNGTVPILAGMSRAVTSMFTESDSVLILGLSPVFSCECKSQPGESDLLFNFLFNHCG